MIKPVIKKATQLLPDQSVVCIVGDDSLPDYLKLSKTEKEYAVRKLKEKQGHIFINSYFKCTYIVRLKEGKSEPVMREELRKEASKMKKLIRSNDHKELVISGHNVYDDALTDFAEGLILSIYSFDRYKTKDDEESGKSFPAQLLLYGNVEKDKISWVTHLTDAVYYTRDLVNEPPNHLTSTVLADEIAQNGKEAGYKVEVLTKGKIEALKMGGLLAVNRGSVDPPAFCILEWKPAKHVNKKPVVLVGKGIVYDTGGLNIKTGDYMNGMKGDMAGAATVSGVFYAISRTKLPLYVIGLIPITDNRPGGNAYTAGDIITMHNKMTVEVGNTDAEGRIILADALSYASKYDPELVITIATLTGSAANTFSNQAIATMTNADRKYIGLLEKCGHDVHERIAELPFWDEYGEMIRSDVADVKNVGGREAGAITAGKFLEKFTEHPLIHLDIAGTGMLKKDDYYRVSEGTGSGLRLLATFLEKLTADYKKLK